MERGIVLRLADVVSEDMIVLDLKATQKDAAIEELARVMCRSPKILDKKVFVEALFDRERLKSTGVGRGVAIPHARTPSVEGIIVALGRSQKGIEFDSLDGAPVQLIFMMGTCPDTVQEYLRLLASVSRLVKNRECREGLLTAAQASDVMEVLSSVDTGEC